MIVFYNVEELCFEKIEKAKQMIPDNIITKFTVASMYRLLIPEILSVEVERIIYLDADIVCHMDIKELWDKYSSYYFCAANDIAIQETGTPFDTISYRFADKYFNSGVLQMNLAAIRNDFLSLWDKGLCFLKEKIFFSCQIKIY